MKKDNINIENENLEKLYIYEKAIKNSKDIVLIFNLEGKIVDVNKEALRVYGYSEEELLSMDIYQIRGNNRCDIIKRQLEKAKKDGIEFQTTHFKKDGSHFPVEVRSICLESSGLIVSSIRDIYSKLNAESEIRELAAIVEYSDDAILGKNLDGIITSWNNGAEKFYGYRKKEMIGQHISKIIPDESKEDINFILYKIKHGEKIKGYETVRITKNGERKNVSIRVSPILDAENNIIGASTIARDITEKIAKDKELRQKYEELSAVYEELIATEEELRANYEQLEETKEEADKANVAKSQFLANMSHEIRTPMNGIIGMIELLSQTSLNEEQKEYVEMLKSSSAILLDIINSILDISKIEAGKLEVKMNKFNLKTIFDKAINELSIACENKHLELNYYIDQIIPFNLIGDSLKLNQILTNLINNAVKFTDKGQITFRVKKVSQKADKITIEFLVQDTGIGIEDSFKSQIFKQFVQQDISYTKQYQGTGLGLAISKELVRMLNGDIWFESEVNKGSKFYFTAEFRLNNEKIINEEVSKIAENKLKAKDNKTILIVEDNKINMEIASAIVKSADYNCILAYNGMEAVKKFETNKVDLILMDIQMPLLNGYDVTKIIREKKEAPDKHVPIIAMTAYAMVGDRELFLENGMDDYISKPFNKDKLIEIINKSI